MTAAFFRLDCEACGRTVAVATGPATLDPAALGWRELPPRCFCGCPRLSWRRDGVDVSVLLDMREAGEVDRPGTLLVAFREQAPRTETPSVDRQESTDAADMTVGAPAEAEGAPHGRTPAAEAAPRSKPAASSATHHHAEAPHDDGRAPGPELGVRSDIRLGTRVRIVDARDIVGTVVAITHHIDGSHRLGVDYWANGSRQSLACEARELEVVT